MRRLMLIVKESKEVITSKEDVATPDFSSKATRVDTLVNQAVNLFLQNTTFSLDTSPSFSPFILPHLHPLEHLGQIGWPHKHQFSTARGPKSKLCSALQSTGNPRYCSSISFSKLKTPKIYTHIRTGKTYTYGCAQRASMWRGYDSKRFHG